MLVTISDRKKLVKTGSGTEANGDCDQGTAIPELTLDARGSSALIVAQQSVLLLPGFSSSFGDNYLVIADNNRLDCENTPNETEEPDQYYYMADVVSANDYYPFGMGMPGRKHSADGAYRYGFNGKEGDSDVHSLTAYDYGFRIYNPSIARFLSVDPLTQSYPWYTPYQFAGNTPIQAIDLDGLEELHYTAINHAQRTAQITIRKHYEVVNTGANRVTDPAYIAAQAPVAANVYNSTSHSYRFVRTLPTSNQKMRRAGLFSKLGFAIGNLFNSSAKRKANYRRKYWTVEARFDIQVRNTPGMTEANANAAINLNHNLNGKITEQALANPTAAAAAPRKTPGANDPNDDEVRLNTTYFGAGGVNRGQIGANRTGNGGELIAHEIGHNIHPNIHPGTDGTSASYPTSGIGSNRTGLAPSKSETETILQSSRHTLPANPPR